MQGLALLRDQFRAIVASAALAVALVSAIFAFATRASRTEPESTTVRFVALTSAPTNESDPSPSPDGKHLAFSMRPLPGGAGQADIYISDGPGSTPVRVTTNPADDMLPAWSPDGGTIAFARSDGRTCDVILLSVADRRERRLTTCGNLEEPHLAWSPNGEWLVESFAPGPDPHRGWQIARVSTATGVREALTLPTPGTLGDHSPSVSPDGSRIAFVRAINGATGDIHLLPFNGGTPTRVTSDNQDIIGLDWMPDGRSLVFASDRAGGYSIFRVPVEGGTPQVVAGGSAKLKHPAVARGSGQIVYESWAYEINLWESPVSAVRSEEGDALAAMRPIVQASDLWNHSPDLSADGKQLAFVSTRSGEPQVWAANRDGSSPRQVSTFTRAALRQPRWSADGTRILISASVSGQPDLYAIDAATGATTRLTDDVDDEIAPSWSRDGASVLFGARRSGTWQVMRLTIADRSRAQVTADGGYAASESPDGRSLSLHAARCHRSVDDADRRRACHAAGARDPRRGDGELACDAAGDLLRWRHGRSARGPPRTAHRRQRRRCRVDRQLFLAGFRRHARRHGHRVRPVGPPREQHHGGRNSTLTRRSQNLTSRLA